MDINDLMNMSDEEMMNISDFGDKPKEETANDIKTAIHEFHRVLKPGGTFIFVSFGQPHFRKPLLSVIGWQIETIEIGMYFMYVMRK